MPKATRQQIESYAQANGIDVNTAIDHATRDGFDVDPKDFETESTPAKAWRVANTPTVDLMYGDGRAKKAIGNIGGTLVDVANRAISPTAAPVEANRDFKNDQQGVEQEMLAKTARGEKPSLSDYARHFAFGAGDSAENVIAPLTSPLSTVMSLAPAVQEFFQGAKALKTAAAIRLGGKAAGVGFGAQGAKQVYDSAPDALQGNPDALENTLMGGSMAAMGGHSALEGRKFATGKITDIGRGALANRPVPDTGGMTTGDVYRTNRDMGIKPNLAQAGQGKFARAVEEFVSGAPGGAGRIAEQHAGQDVAMRNALSQIEDTFDPANKGKNIADVGGQMNRALTTAQDVHRQNASQSIQQTLGDMQYSTADTADILAKAQELKDRLTRGELTSVQAAPAVKVLDEIIARYGDHTNNKSMVDALFTDRSNLMNTQFSNSPVADVGEGAMREMAHTMRGSLEQAATKQGKLPQFNDAMAQWEKYQGTFGERNSPIAQAIREPDPTKVLDKFIGNKGSYRAVEMLKEVAPEYVGALKREFVRRLYDTGDTGVRENYGNMQNRLLHYNEPFVEALFSPAELEQLRGLGAGAKSMKLDVNPSGSGKYPGQLLSGATTLGGVGGGIAAMAMDHPIAGAAALSTAAALPVISNAAARFLGNTPITDHLMGYTDPHAAVAAKAKAALSTKQRQAPQGGKAVANPFGQKAAAKAKQAVNAFHADESGAATVPSLDRFTKKIDNSLSTKLEPTAKKIAKVHNDSLEDGVGGSTYHLGKGNMFGKDAFAVSIYPELTHIIDGEKVTPELMKEYLSRPEVQKVLKSDPRVSVGTWTEGGKTTLDVVATPSDLKQARELGRRYNQDSIFDLQNARTIKTGGSQPDADILNLANNYNSERGLGKVTHREYADVDPRAGDIATAYEEMLHNPNHPKVAASYAALADEVRAQFDHATKAGIKFEPWEMPGQPYRDSGDMMRDVKDNKHLYFFKGGDMPADHPLAAVDADGLTVNDKLRAVHDLYGHAKDANQFGPRGEENAWLAHRQMFSDAAIPALTSETKGQNSWVNQRNLDKPASARPFAEQKAGLLPEEFHSREATPMEGRLKDMRDPGTIDAIHYSNADLKEVDPAYYGQNMTNELSHDAVNRPDIARKNAYPDLWANEAYLGKRTDLFRGKGERFATRSNRYGAELNASRYYDLVNDPDGIKVEAKKELMKQSKERYGVNMPPSDPQVEAYAMKMLRDRGYSGRLDINDLVASWDKVPVSKEVIPEAADRVMTAQERNSLKTDAAAKRFADNLASLPPLKEWEDIAKGGEVGRKWYDRGNKAFDALVDEAPDYFGPGDREKFANLVAATSPQQGVYMNLREALGVWKKYIDADRPTGKKLERLLDNNTVMSGAKTPNAMKALAGEEMWPAIEKSKFFKVPSFAKNLNGLLNAVTNDSWMGIFSGIENAGAKVSRPEFYHPISVMTRLAADKLGWAPAEAQAAIWTFTRTLAEQSGWSKATGIKPRPAIEALKTLDDATIKKYGDDFADIMANDSETRSILKKLGVNLATLDEKLQAIGHGEVTSGAAAVDSDSARKLAGRIERARGAEGELDAHEVPDEGSTDFNTEDFGDEKPAKVRSGVVEASPIHKAELANWQSAFDSASKNTSADAGALARAKEAAKIGTIMGQMKKSHLGSEETYVAQRNGRAMGAVQLDTYAADRGAPLTIDWLATHPDVILGNSPEKGIGTELFKHAVQRAADLGVGLNLQSAEGAKTFYEKMGMSKVDGLDESRYKLTPSQVKAIASQGAPTSASVKAQAASAPYRLKK